MQRRRFLALGTGTAAALLQPSASAGAGPETYVKDVDFLLAGLEQRAGHFFALKKIDWSAVTKQFRAEVKSVVNDTGHLKLCQRLVACLKDGHAGIIHSKIPPDPSAGRGWAGPGLHLVVIGGGVFVRRAFREAEAAGIRSGQPVTAIDGVPARQWLDRKVAAMRETGGYSTDHHALYAACHGGLADQAGTTVSLMVHPAGGAEQAVTLTRNGGPNFVPSGPVFLPAGLQQTGRQSYGKTKSGFAYLHLRDVPGDLETQLDRMLAEVGAAPGLILDTRANGGGGCDHAAVFGRFVPMGKFYDRYEGAGGNPYTGNMVVIIDAGVRSAGETVAGMFKETRRAHTIGDTPTAGMSASKATLTVPSGLFTVRFAVASNMARYNKGQGIEGLGIPPHQPVPYLPEDLAAGRDTQIAAAEALLHSGFPSEEVDYVPPARK